MNKIGKAALLEKARKTGRAIKAIPLPIAVFVIVALLSGLLFIKNTGSFSGPDLYTAHYRAALAAATGQSFTDPVDVKNNRIQYLNGEEKYFKSGDDCTFLSLVSEMVKEPLRSDEKRACIASHDAQLSEQKTVTVPSTLQYPPVSYAPQAIGLKLGMITDMEPVTAQTLARILNLLTYIAILVLSMAIIPKGRWLLAILGLLPTSIFLASSLSADGLNIAWSFLFVSYLVRLFIQKTKIKPLQVAAIVVLGVGLFVLKVAYAPLVLLILALKKNVIKPKTKWLLFLSTFIVGAGLYAVWSANWSSLNATVDTAGNMSMILHNLPQAVTGIFISILYVPSMLFSMPQTAYIATAIVIVSMLVIYLRSVKLLKPVGFTDFIDKYRLQILAVLAAMGSLGLTYAALLLTWTDISEHGWLNIQGFQGRYVLPILPLLITVYYMPLVKRIRDGKNSAPSDRATKDDA